MPEGAPEASNILLNEGNCCLYISLSLLSFYTLTRPPSLDFVLCMYRYQPLLSE